MTETIFALASGAGRAAVAVVRLSGPLSGPILKDLAGALPPPRMASLRALRAGATLLDEALTLWFPGPRSYTGEDMAELHLHGGPAVIEGVAAAILARGGVAARPGEFTRRAVRHGKMDLVSAEAVNDIVEAETESQRIQAFRQRGGALTTLYADWQRRVTSCLAEVEAGIEFGEEDDVRALDVRAGAALGALLTEIGAHLDDGGRAERLRTGIVFAVVGAPNAGKTSLVNALAGREVGLVSSIPGTTRDVLETRLVLGDIPVTLLDTAGLRPTDDPLERAGVARATQRAIEADAVLRVIAPDAPWPGFLERDGLDVRSKADLLAAPPPDAVSVATGHGMEALRDRLATLARRFAGVSEAPGLTNARQRRALTRCRGALVDARGEFDDVLVAEHLRLAGRALGEVLGQVDSEAVLDDIFGRFCIGK